MANPNETMGPTCGIDQKVKSMAFASLYFLLFPPALLLNVLVAWISMHLKSKTNFMVYLKHLVAADLLMTLTFPVKAASELPGASDGLLAFACQFSQVFFYLAMNMSTILMGLISLDRFFKIVQPGGKLLCRNLLFSKILSVSMWLFLLCVNAIPIIVTTNEDPRNKSKQEFCMRMKSATGHTVHNTAVIFSKIIFWVMCVLIILCYMCITKKVVDSYRRSHSNNNQQKRQAKVRVFLILLVFLICYVPYHVVRLPYTKTQGNNTVTCPALVLKVLKDLAQWLSATNVCMDPLIYFFLCKAFRKKFKESCTFNCLLQSSGQNEEVFPSSDTSL